MNAADDGSGARYSTSFKEVLFGGRCEVEVTVDISTHAATSFLSMASLLGGRGSHSISLEDLKRFARTVSSMRSNAELLRTLVEDASDHQLNSSVAGATIIVVRPPGKPARFTFSIGALHREGVLEELDTQDLDEAIRRIESLQDRVVQKVAKRSRG